jgi:hypothetical protein
MSRPPARSLAPTFLLRHVASLRFVALILSLLAIVDGRRTGFTRLEKPQQQQQRHRYCCQQGSYATDLHASSLFDTRFRAQNTTLKLDISKPANVQRNTGAVLALLQQAGVSVIAAR